MQSNSQRAMNTNALFELRPYQADIADKVFEYMRSNPGKHPLVGMPTGSGKTVVMADIILKAITRWPNTHVLVLSHVKEILEQDYNSITRHTGVDVGLYSAGLESRDIKQVTVAGIQSVYSKPELFRHYNLIIIDECHLIPPGGSSMYRTFFSGLDKPRYLGLTATPFRLGAGYIYGSGKEHIFDDMIVDLTTMHRFNKLVKDGYLCKLKTQATKNELDPDGIKTTGGDYDLKEMSEAFDRFYITRACVQEIEWAKKAGGYKKLLVFAIDIDHAESIAEMLIEGGNRAMAVHSKLEMDRSLVLDMFRNRQLDAIVNVNVLTTGFDDPEIDMIAIMRPTKSPVIHVQTIGRGLRIAPGKDHCLIMDFAGNTERNGPINDVRVYKKGKGKGGDPITKTCPGCDTIHHPSVRVCDFCGHKFVFKTNLNANAVATDVIRESHQKKYTVSDVVYSLHQKANRPDTVKVSYICGVARVFHEYVCLEHPGWAGAKGRQWVKHRGGEAKTVAEAMAESKTLRKPTTIVVDTSSRYPDIIDFDFPV